MKTVKTSLVILFTAAIGAGILFWLTSLKEVDKVKAPENLFTGKIQQEIENLNKESVMSFSNVYFNEIQLQINEFYKQGRFSENQIENDQWREILEKRLYSAYSAKFIRQALYVFSKPEWRHAELKIIQADLTKLRSSEFLEKDSPVDKDFVKIQEVLNKYYEITRFISSCNVFTYSGMNLSDRFPTADVTEKILHAERLLNNNLENSYINNCTWLHNELKEIPENLFRKHVEYLDNKIDEWSEMYPNFISQSDYSNNLYLPIIYEIGELNNDIYKVAYFDNAYNELLQKWRADNTKAYYYDYNSNSNE